MATYTGPSVGQMLKNHTLAHEIITRHDGPQHESVLDDSELRLLQRFCADPSSKDEILDGYVAGSQPQSLVKFVVHKHGSEQPALEESEIVELRDWFTRGGAGDLESGEPKL